jgi:hypothetical protein
LCFKLLTYKIWEILDIGKDTNSNFKVQVTEMIWNYEMESGPLVSRSDRLTGQLPPHERGDAVVARPLPATSHRPMNRATCRPHATVTPPLPLLGHHFDKEKRHFTVALNSLASLLYSSLHCRLPLYSSWLATTEPPPWRPTRPKGAPWCRAPPAPSASRVTAYRSWAAEVSSSPTTSVRSSSSTAVVRAPPASPPLKEGPLESVVLKKKWRRFMAANSEEKIHKWFHYCAGTA